MSELEKRVKEYIFPNGAKSEETLSWPGHLQSSADNYGGVVFVDA